MENIVNFLTENYFWIMAVLIIGIVTTIGFLADVRSKSRKPKKQKNVQEQEMVANAPVNQEMGAPAMTMAQPQVNQEELARVNLSNSQVVMENPNVSQPTNPYGNSLDFANQNIPVQPVENIIPQAEPVMVNPTSMPSANEIGMGVNQPVEPIPTVNPNMVNMTNPTVVPNYNMQQMNVNPVESVPPVQVQPVMPTAEPQPVVQPSYTIPSQPVTQQPVAPQPVNVTPMMSQNMYQPQPNVGMQPTENQTVNPQPSNPTTNENQFWKL